MLPRAGRTPPPSLQPLPPPNPASKPRPSSAGPGLLAELHVELLRGIVSNPKALDIENWTTGFSNRLRHEWAGLSGRRAPPFRPTKGREAHDYAALDIRDRCDRCSSGGGPWSEQCLLGERMIDTRLPWPTKHAHT